MKRLFLWVLSLFFLIGTANVWAHSVTIDDPFDMALGDSIDIGHEDDEPWKGTLTLTVTNTGLEAWGDFHFYIAGDREGSVVFTDSDVVPLMSGVDDYIYTLTEGGLNLNFFFYDDPVLNGESVTFQIFTDNTARQNGFFAIAMEASPVPLPGSLMLLSSGLLGVLACRKKRTG